MTSQSTSGNRALSAVTFAYPEVGTADRARLAAALMGGRRPGGAFVLSTCLRVEVVVEGGIDALEKSIGSAFGAPVAGAVVRRDRDAVEHLFRVAAGLESPVLGEVEVLTQFREAVATARDGGAVSGWALKLLESAIAAGRSVRRVLPPSPYGSLADVAAGFIDDADRVAVLGSGVMASAVVSSLLALEPSPEVTMVARRSPTSPPDGVRLWPFDRLRQALVEYPVVVSATSAKTRLVPDTELADLLQRRSTRLRLIDMAMPPDFQPSAGLPVDYTQIDELASRVAERVPAAEADREVAVSAEDAWRRAHGAHAVAPVVERLYSEVDDLVDRTVERFHGRLSDPADVEVLRQAVHTVARTILARPVARLSEVERPDEHAVTLAEVFGIHDA